MTDREKLIAILANNATCVTLGIDGCDVCPYKHVKDCYTEALADHLLANGVVVREKGEWIHDGQRIHNGVDWWHCSKCDKTAVGVEIKYNFCSNCGADMRKGENG